MIRLVLKASKKYTSVFQIQMAVTACLYNLTHDVSQKLHPHLLNEIVKSNLDAMEVFPQHHQMQKNCLLTMCSDRYDFHEKSLITIFGHNHEIKKFEIGLYLEQNCKF